MNDYYVKCSLKMTEKETLRKYLLLDREIEYQVRYGRDPGEEPYEERDRLYNLLWKMVID